MSFETEIKTPYIEGSIENIREMLPNLYPEQQEDVLKIERRFKIGKGYLCTHGTGTGKAQPLDAKVMTPNGWKTMGELKVGDKVIGANGTPVNITGVYPQGLKEIYRVTLSDGSFTECCNEHLWETQTLYQRRKASVNPNWDCSKPKVNSLSEIRKTLDKGHFIPIVKPIELKEVNVDIHPYIMGSLLGDGSFTGGSIKFFNSDLEVTDKISSLLPESMELALRKYPERSPKYIIKLKETPDRNENGDFGRNPWISKLKKLKLYGLKSDKKFVPEIYLRGSIEQRIELLQGLMDTDGWVDKKSKSPYFSSASKDLADAVAYIARSLGGTAKISRKSPQFTHNGVKKRGLDAYSVLLNLPSGIQPFSLTRKLDIYEPNTKYPPRRKIVEVEYVGVKEAQCIAVDDERHLYVTDDCILTHNTSLALGVIKRFLSQGKRDILIVVPTEAKSIDWIQEAIERVSIDITKLEGIDDAGHGIVVTTYANFYQNESLESRKWDLVVYDEAHYLNQNMKGDSTVYLQRHKSVSNLPSKARDKAEDIVGPLPRFNRDWEDGSFEKTMFPWKVESWLTQVEHYTWEISQKTNVLFLSATPFAYHKSISYADGCLFEIEESIGEKQHKMGGYNTASGFDQFLIENFGYRMNYNKLTIPETGVDVDLLEREFFEKHVEKGVMSTRVLDLDVDYSRDFFQVSSGISEYINEGMEMWYRPSIKDKYKYLAEFVSRKYTYQYTSQLLESIKAHEVIDRIKKHLDLGRKVVIFHSFNHTTASHPFHFDADELSKGEAPYVRYRLSSDIDKFNKDFPHLIDFDLDDLQNARKTLREAFPDILEFNGTVPKKKRKKNEELFNNNNSGKDLIMVQSKAGREGISLHDKVGDKQRVLINLSLPTAPTEAIQTEGRIYRSGLKSNAIYEYPVLYTNFEKIAFAEKISVRAKTAENLAMGMLARDLETSFKEGYLNFSTNPPDIDQGVGGKEKDRNLNTISEFDRAKTFYWSRGKKNASTKSFEGVDYFSTPEPLGLKIAQWMDLQPNERGLEPSAGHGAISRWFPGHAVNTFLEPSLSLMAEMAINSKGKAMNDTFEKFYIGNKFEGIAMNPPFGRAGKTAVEHLKKAVVHHLYRYEGTSRLYAIVPTTSSVDKFLEEVGEDRDMSKFRVTGQLYMPDCVFERAGTRVMTKIVKIEHEDLDSVYQEIDMRNSEDINEFFDRIENLIF